MRRPAGRPTRLVQFLAALVWLLLFAGRVQAASITLAWDANTEPDVAGYVVAFGTTPTSLTQAIDVGRVTSWTFNGLTSGQTYYFAVQAYNTTGLKSAFSPVVTAVAAAATQSYVGSVTLAWDPNTEPTLGGYLVYYGTTPYTYTKAIDAGNSVSATVSGLAPGPYYFAVVAYSQTGVQSPPSAQVGTTVTAPVATVVVAPSINNLKVGGTTTLTAAAYDGAGNLLPTASFTWSSANVSVAYPGVAAGSTTVVTAAGVGGTSISATAGGVSASATVNVSSSVARVAITPTSAALQVGQSTSLSAQAYDANNNPLSVPITWATNNSGVATISATSGTTISTTAAGAGSASLTASAGGVSASAPVTVTSVVNSTVARVVVNPASATLKSFGGTITLTATAYDSANRPVPGVSFTWTTTNSSATRLSSTSGGSVTVTGRRQGSATITVNATGTSATATSAIGVTRTGS